jgi:hypothetical protein
MIKHDLQVVPGTENPATDIPDPLRSRKPTAGSIVQRDGEREKIAYNHPSAQTQPPSVLPRPSESGTGRNNMVYK